MSTCELTPRPVIVVTGFGPFGEHKVNASWEAVKLLQPDDIYRKYGLHLVTIEIPVVYDRVDQLIPALWQKYKPLLFIHVGVSGVARKITIESCANGDDYRRLDCSGKTPINGQNCCKIEKNSKITCSLNIEELCEMFNKKFDDIKTCISSNAGRYLCEYIYFTSLSINPSRTIFIHVPDINKPYSLAQITRGLDAIIEICIMQLQECRLHTKYNVL